MKDVHNEHNLISKMIPKADLPSGVVASMLLFEIQRECEVVCNVSLLAVGRLASCVRRSASVCRIVWSRIAGSSCIKMYKVLHPPLLKQL